jgi:outer membrane biosynthesis protein TonB
MMTLATTFGCLLLLANPQPKKMPAATFLFQAQENSPAQTPPDQPAQPDETKPAQPDKTEQPAQPTADSPKPKPAAPQKTTAKASTGKKVAKKRQRTKEGPIVVVKNGGTTDSQGQISSPASNQQTTQQLKNTDTLLSAANTNLQKISGKQLNPGQQDMVTQIHNYIRQSKDAAKNGDVQGANNLAVKAHLLSEELVKP